MRTFYHRLQRWQQHKLFHRRLCRCFGFTFPENSLLRFSTRGGKGLSAALSDGLFDKPVLCNINVTLANGRIPRGLSLSRRCLRNVRKEQPSPHHLARTLCLTLNAALMLLHSDLHTTFCHPQAPAQIRSFLGHTRYS